MISPTVSVPATHPVNANAFLAPHLLVCANGVVWIHLYDSVSQGAVLSSHVLTCTADMKERGR